jgi:hypothetical protein
MNQNKSPEYDNISSKFIKLTASNISEPLAHIFNLTFLSGNIPDKLNIALVIPIFKANEKNKFTNYRPISISIRKTRVEKINQLHRKKQDIIKSNQMIFISVG